MELAQTFAALLADERIQKALAYLRDDQNTKVEEQKEMALVSGAPHTETKVRSPMYLAKLQGFGVENCFIDEAGNAMFPIQGGKWFNEMSVGSHLANYDSFLALTHFKGHAMGGFGGSNKNIGIGCADGRVGKGMIHTVPGDPNLWSIAQEELMERMTESTKSVFDRFGQHICYINVLRNMSVSCDCEGTAAMPVVTPNIGIVASLDILAADQASVDLIYALKPEDGHDLVQRMETRHGLRQLSYMKELGMGHDRYTLVDIDHDDAPILPAQAVQDVTPFAPDGQE